MHQKDAKAQLILQAQRPALQTGAEPATLDGLTPSLQHVGLGASSPASADSDCPANGFDADARYQPASTTTSCREQNGHDSGDAMQSGSREGINAIELDAMLLGSADDPGHVEDILSAPRLMSSSGRLEGTDALLAECSFWPRSGGHEAVYSRICYRPGCFNQSPSTSTQPWTPAALATHCHYIMTLEVRMITRHLTLLRPSWDASHVFVTAKQLSVYHPASPNV